MFQRDIKMKILNLSHIHSYTNNYINFGRVAIVEGLLEFTLNTEKTQI